MSARHTPGPWDLRDDDKRISVGIGLVEGPNGYDVAEVYNDDCDRDEAWANARLIAAAPCLLEALEEAAALIGAPSSFRDLRDGDTVEINPTVTIGQVKKFAAAIARARGAQ